MKNILITGGSGFIGSNFIEYILKITNDVKIINFDNLTYAGNPENLKNIENDARYKFIKGDICDEELVSKIFSENNIDSVINFAAETHVDRSIHDPNIFIKTNVLGTGVLLSNAKRTWGDNFSDKRFLQVSTDEVYGTLPEDDKSIKFTENTPLQPHSPYSASKTGADCVVQSYFDTYKFPTLITRCSNNYGPYQFPEKLIPLIINNALNDKDLPIYGDGKQIRDWLFVEDHCDAIWTVLNKGKIGEVYNVGGDNEIMNIDIVKHILDHLKKPHSLITYVKDRLGHDRRYAIDAAKIKNELEWTPKYKFEDKIKDTIDWYLSNSEWINNVISGEYQNWIDKNYK
ncbi:MAG: dTDP-glucose 4,6-dehydratase [Candidatus Delongbacteria bacterium]|jgi:dTDP-glucose 4,6-dehydratase|nr:dTDP-glucose 4,6-dehydratase [Candidatus Delongbacteria bacterium]